MVGRVLLAPWWAKGLVAGVAMAVYVGVVLAVVFRIARPDVPRPWLSASRDGLLSGLLLGLVAGVLLAGAARADGIRPQLRALPDADRLTTWRAGCLRGRVPADPQIRQSALRLVQLALARARRTHRLTVAGTVALFGATIALIYTDQGATFALPAAMSLTFFGIGLESRPRQLARRAEQLRTGPP